MADREEEDLSPSEREALGAYEAPGPAPGFADRLLDARGRAVARRRLALAALAAALLVAGALLLPRDRSGAVVATARTPLSIGGRATAVAEAGAALRYRVGRGGDAVVEQERGAVTYHVNPGGPFLVRTSLGEAQVVGTSFQVELVTMKKPLALAAAAALVLVVYEGRVLLRSPGGELAVGAGQRAVAVEGAAPSPAPAPEPGPAHGERRAALDREERARLLRDIAAARGARAAQRPGAAPAQRPEAAPRAPGEPGSLDKDYVRQQVREVIPLVQECYVSALEKAPQLRGRIVLRFTISGEPELGGLVESAEVQEAGEGLKDPALQECMRESMYALRFKAPQGGGQVVVSYPFLLSPDGPPDGGAAPDGR